ncbi:major surface protease, GP63, putative [Bodo saltans]|uniref:Leishmanolysin-like peptidase n=2 Tax=Bodo saltans TaxID=75058 RepID=A0A0S4IUT6_BODSA|nr:major surface protease, GP63, putative [Bodo saltans]|eukprot:CUG00210.1 major surface protease, GP63, putative [Bodo saltans]
MSSFGLIQIIVISVGLVACFPAATATPQHSNDVEEVDWSAVYKHHEAVGKHRVHHHHHDHEHSEDAAAIDASYLDEIEDNDRVASAQKKHVGHHCIHDEVKMIDIPAGTVDYGVDVKQALLDTHTKRGQPDFHHLQKTLTDRHQRKGKSAFASDDQQIPTPTAFPHHQVSHEFMEMSADGSMKRLRSEQAVSYVGSAFRNIRIKYFFNVDGNGQCSTVGQTVTTYRGTTTRCTAADILTASMKSYIMDTIMARGTEYLMDALNVIPVVGNLTISTTRCGASPGIIVPEVHRTVGVDNADFILYVTANPLGTAASTVAFAATCLSDQNLRPIAGSINFVPQALGNNIANKASQANLDVNTAIHESSHALGYTSFFTNGYVNMSGSRVPGGIVSAYDSTLQKTTTKMTSPRVVAAARAYFNCSTLAGVEIEDQGGAGTSGVHWEKRILGQEYIAGVLSTSATYISSLTLAYFEDTGHYTANYAFAQDGGMQWYKNKGCTVLSQKCNSAANRASGEFCFDTNSQSNYCTNDRTAGGYCDVSIFSSALPSNFQYFTDATLGSRVIVDDYCPSVLPYTNKVCIEASNVDSQDIYGNLYNPASRCFVSNLIQTDFDLGSPQDTRCFPYSCSALTGSILINIRGQTARCPNDRTAGYADLSRVSGYQGVILCPAASLFCADLNAPTPAPTPAPPTPVPTPAPPGYTPAPAPVVHSAKVWFNSSMPTNCVNRTPCAANLSSLFPACRLIAKRLTQCYGTNCQAEVMAWTAQAGYTAKCSNVDDFALECVDSFVGAAALCALATGSATSMAGISAVVLLLLMIAQFWAIVV